MNSLWFAGLLTLLLAAPGAAQDSKPAEGVPAPSNIRGAQYPRIHDDLRVTFRIKAPDAQKVVFGFFDSQRYPAKKGEDGFWTATTEPQVPGFHYYRVFIDGAEVNDPASETFYGTGKDDQRDRDPREGRRLLSPQGRAARRGPRALVLLQDDRGLEAHLRLHPARLRRRSRHAVSGAVPAARRGRGRTGLAEPGAHGLHHGQPDRREEGEADARGHGAGLRPPARRAGRPARAASARRARPESPAAPRLQPDVQRVRGRDGQGPDPDDRRDLPHDPEPREPGDGRTLDGRHADVPDHAQASGSVLLHRRLQRRGRGLRRRPFDPKTAHGGVMANADEFNKKVRLRLAGHRHRPSRSACTRA